MNDAMEDEQVPHVENEENLEDDLEDDLSELDELGTEGDESELEKEKSDEQLDSEIEQILLGN